MEISSNGVQLNVNRKHELIIANTFNHARPVCLMLTS
jgi:hypothetical protein